VSLAVPLEIILAVGIAIDLILAYLGFNLFKVLRKKLRARRQQPAKTGSG
jgi:hypothetical protein